MKRTPFKRKPISEQKPMKRSPMRKVGKKGKINAKADKESKADLSRKGIDYCQLCGRNIGLGRSHSHKRRHETNLRRVALLCNFPCHNFIEHKLTKEERQVINDFIIDTDFEGEYKFQKVLELLPPEKATKMRDTILNYNG